MTSSDGGLIERAVGGRGADRATVPAQAASSGAVADAGQAPGRPRPLAALAMAWLTVLQLRLRGGRRS
ncbi:hypothetical protein NMG29_34570 [Streptomyces cocklensis]|uniref:Uncharacterized protein n=1 Tax=Actinacidiphila cocklensis TaxID=887465 RepID=A0A9W4DPI0_9ACTN|nr:hypothetical protein [Actinacidiphila cocklensis]MDD1063238.1 hypothetical protein [Actinacidiphila cocklensis]CAG6393674.1 conserved hypothetical protein [Actinacidiphila cocklensis]